MQKLVTIEQKTSQDITGVTFASFTLEQDLDADFTKLPIFRNFHAGGIRFGDLVLNNFPKIY